MRFTSVLALFAAGLVAPATARSLFSPAVFPSEDHKIPGESPMYHCDRDFSDDLLTIQRIDVSPNPPKAGQELVITASGVISKDIEEGAYANVDVKLGLIRLLHQTFDFCEQSKNLDVNCPLEKGNITIQKTIRLPKQIPPAKFVVMADVYSEDDESITCLTATVDFMPKQGFGAYEDNEDL